MRNCASQVRVGASHRAALCADPLDAPRNDEASLAFVRPALGQHRLDIAGREIIEKREHALAVEWLGHLLFSAGVWPGSHFRLHCEVYSTAINRQKAPVAFDVNSSKMVHSLWLYFRTLLCGALPQSWRSPAAPAVFVSGREGRGAWRAHTPNGRRVA